MNELIERIDGQISFQESIGNLTGINLLLDCKAEIITLNHTKNALDHACALVEDKLAKSKKEIKRLLLANEILLGENISLDHTCAMLANDNCLTEAISEPVAWMVEYIDEDGEIEREYNGHNQFSCGKTGGIPLYNAQPSIQALIDEIDGIECEYLDDYEVKVKSILKKYRVNQK